MNRRRSRRWAVALIVAASIGAGPSTQPTTAPTVVAGEARPVVASPAVTSSIHDLAAKIRGLNRAEAQRGTLPSVACFDLSTPVVEKPADFSLFGGDPTALTLRALVERIHHARDDKRVRALLLTLNAPGTNLAQSQEIRDALIECRKAGKKTFVYADGYDTDSYTIASGATNVCLLPGGELMMPGVAIQTMYLKGLFDKLGVVADYVQIGAYKGADEEYTRTGPSKEFAGEINKLIDGLYDQVVNGIAANRNLAVTDVKRALDQSILTAADAKQRGFVDHLVDMDGVRQLVRDELGTQALDFAVDYDGAKRDDVDLSSPFALFSLLTKKQAVSTKPAVAIVFADGVIVDGPSGGGGFGSLTGGATVGSDAIRSAMRTIARDDTIKAVVIRINSPGGSALASEAMWQAVRRVAKEKPVVISVGSMAASGGYYLASAGDRIYADPSAIVGSIGVVGGKFVYKDLLDKFGVTTQTFTRGGNADLFGSETPFSDSQRRMVRDWMTQTYDQFTQRVMTTRQGKIKNIADVAQGRVFVAAQAKDLGMVDEIGGLDAALTYAAGKVDLPTDGFDVRVVPAPRTLADMITGDNGPSAMAALQPKVELSADSVLQAVPADVRSMVGEQVEIMRLMQQHPVVLAAPFVVRVK